MTLNNVFINSVKYEKFDFRKLIYLETDGAHANVSDLPIRLVCGSIDARLRNLIVRFLCCVLVWVEFDSRQLERIEGKMNCTS